MANAAPVYQANVKAGREIDYELTLSPGDGRRLTLDEIKKAEAGGAGNAGSTGESATDRAKREELLKKNEELKKSNERNAEINKIVSDAFTAGNTARTAKNWDEAIKQYDIGLTADAEQPALLTNKSDVLKSRGVDRYNAAIRLKQDDPAKKPGLDSANADFKASVDAANKAIELLNKETPATDPNEQKRQALNKYVALSVRAEAMRLFVSIVDHSQADAGAAAFEEYMAAETDPAKKSRAQLDLAQMLFDAAAYDKAKAAYQKILAEKPDDPDALANMGLIFFNEGAMKEQDGKKDEAKALYQQAANYLGQFVAKAPDTHKFKADAKAVLEELRNQQNVQAEKPASTPSRRKRP
jgi:tetratricopeptide (TPR) repeat protein